MPRPGDSETGGARKFLQARADSTVRTWVERRAATETDGNESELIRRLVAFALPRMPQGWIPEEDHTQPAS